MSPSGPLRLLTLTNTFPPTAKGGYGEICGDVSAELARRGHEVTVLTEAGSATAADAASESGVVVRRELELLLGPWRHPLRALRVAARTERSVRGVVTAGVDAALVWHMRGILKPCLRVLHDAGIPVLYMLHDRWVLYERAGAFTVPLYRLDRVGLTAIRNALLAPIARWRELRAPLIEREGVVCFVSEWLRDEHARLGWRPADARVIPAGVSLARFGGGTPAPAERAPTRLLYAGRLHPTKGLQTVISALADLPEPTMLTVVGHEDDPAYAARARDLASALGVSDRVEWLGDLARGDMPRLLREHDVFVYPSIGVESGWLGVLEGLAAGALVVTSAPGAPRELVRDGENALLVRPDDPADLVRVVERLALDERLRLRLRAGARATASAQALDVMVDAIESLVRARVGRVHGESA